MKNFLTLFSLCFVLNMAMAQTDITIKTKDDGGSTFPSGEQFKDANITYTIIPAPNNTWCYDILKDGSLFIHQPSKPAMPGHEGFKTKEQAAKVAELVISKMKKGEMPPTVTEEELKKMNAIPSSTK